MRLIVATLFWMISSVCLLSAFMLYLSMTILRYQFAEFIFALGMIPLFMIGFLFGMMGVVLFPWPGSYK